jgi:hypothetical protein
MPHAGPVKNNQADRSVSNTAVDKGELRMKITTMACFAGGLLALVLTAPPQARADQWDQKIVFTFSAPVEIPGQILPAGTYVFKLLDSASDRNIVQVFNDRENHLFGTFLTIPDYRLKPTDKPIVTFTERAAGCLRPRFCLSQGKSGGIGQGQQRTGSLHA